MFVLSSLYSILPAFKSWTALATSIVTVPALGLGIKPFGPSTRPRRPTTLIMLGVATTLSKSNHPSFWIFGISSSAPTNSAPAATASSALSPLANTRTRTFLPVPLGKTTAPRICWSAWRPSRPILKWASIVSSNFALAAFFTMATASGASYKLVLSLSFAASWYLFPLFILNNLLWYYRERPSHFVVSNQSD